MSVFRVNKNKNYTVMSNYHLKDKNLSLKAKGLLSQMLSLPDDWDYTVGGLCAINKEGKDSIRTTLQELEKRGYLKRTLVRDEKGNFADQIYNIFEEPNADYPQSENPTSGNPISENPTQLNTNKQNTNKQNTDNTTNKLVEKTPKNYGNEEINELFDEWEKHCGFRIDTKVKMNRYACQRLIKSRGVDAVKKAIPYVAQAQADQYAPVISNFMDLADKWNNLGVWVNKKIVKSRKCGKIVIPSGTNERSEYE